MTLDSKRSESEAEKVNGTAKGDEWDAGSGCTDRGKNAMTRDWLCGSAVPFLASSSRSEKQV